MRFSFKGRQSLPLALIQGVIGFEWVRGGLEKLTDSAYIGGMDKTIGVFAGKNPNGWYRDFLLGSVKPSAAGFGYVVEYGEFLVGIGLIAAALVALFHIAPRVIETGGIWVTAVAGTAGAFMSLNFWFAAGWLSVSTDGLNLMMGLVQTVLVGTAVAVLIGRRNAKRHDAFETLGRTGVTVDEPRPATLVR